VSLSIDDATLLEFWRERRLCSLTTLRPDGTPHVVPVGATLDPVAGLVRVITSRTSRKVSYVRATPNVAVCQFEGRQWCTVEGRATVNADPTAVAEAERRYAERYRTPRPNPRRIVLEIAVTRILGSL
jgi:PPOX class probable F420-dependent enzyme